MLREDSSSATSSINSSDWPGSFARIAEFRFSGHPGRSTPCQKQFMHQLIVLQERLQPLLRGQCPDGIVLILSRLVGKPGLHGADDTPANCMVRRLI